MNSYKTLAVVVMAAMPLALLTVMSFLSTGERGPTQAGMPVVPPNVVAVREKATLALQAKAEADEAVAKDPAGLREKIDGAASKAHPYATASILAEAEAASAATDLKKIENALTSLETAGITASDLLPEVERRQRQLGVRRTWLANRIAAAEALTAADKTMNGPRTIAGTEECLKVLFDLRRRLPNDAAEGDEESTDSLTTSEAGRAAQLRAWAEYRRAFLQAKAKHAKIGEAKPEALAALVEEWDRFLASNGRPGAPDRDECVTEARSLRMETRLAFLWATAVAQKNAATLAPAVLKWLEEPRSREAQNTSDEELLRKGADLMRAWLDRSLPPVPAAVKGLDGMKEGVVDDRQAGKRLIAIFQPVPGQENRYRWWYSAAKRRDLPLGEDSGFLQQPPFDPRYQDWLVRYRKLRDEFVNQGGFLDDVDPFVTACRSLADEYAEHAALPALDQDNPFDRAAADWDTNVFKRAAVVATEFQAACRESGLGQRLQGAAR